MTGHASCSNDRPRRRARRSHPSTGTPHTCTDQPSLRCLKVTYRTLPAYSSPSRCGGHHPTAESLLLPSISPRPISPACTSSSISFPVPYPSTASHVLRSKPGAPSLALRHAAACIDASSGTCTAKLHMRMCKQAESPALEVAAGLMLPIHVSAVCRPRE